MHRVGIVRLADKWAATLGSGDVVVRFRSDILNPNPHDLNFLLEVEYFYLRDELGRLVAHGPGLFDLQVSMAGLTGNVRSSGRWWVSLR